MLENISKVRPKFHITGGEGWINDPNGLVKFNGEYHVFFQYYSDATYWGPMHWGHVKSKDLTHWERLPIALRPDEQDDGCFSGSAIVFRNKLWLLYTSYKQNDGEESSRQTQALASSSDGVNFQKHGIVIGESDLPPEYYPCDFRDPKIMQADDCFYCLIAARKRGGRGRILMYKSVDLFKWQFVCDVTGHDSSGTMIECPDYFRELRLLTYCEQNQPSEGSTHLNLHSTFAQFGDMDFSSSFNPSGEKQIIDYGFDFYAAQTFHDEPIMFGWLGMWERNYPSDKYGFAGMLTVPRKLGRNGNELIQTPVYAGKKVFEASVSGKLSDRIIEGVIKIEIKGLKKLCLKMRKSGDNYASLTLCGNEWIFDRSKAGAEIVGMEKDGDSLSGIRRMPYKSGQVNNLEIVFDTFSIEIFADGKALSSTIYPELKADGLELETECGECRYSRYEIE